MTKVMIDPGVCGFVTSVEAESEDKMTVTVNVKSGCESIRAMMETLGDSFDAYEICLKKPGEGAFFEFASQNFPAHASCPVLSGMIKCMEVECMLALKKDVSIKFEE